jgi:hypothetical protein
LTRSVILNLVSQATALGSIASLFYASAGVPWEMQSWKGNTEPEKRWRQRQRILAWVVGFPLAVVSIGCQTILTLWP